MNLFHPGVVDGKPSIAENYPGPDYVSSMSTIQFAEPRHHVQEKLSQNKPDHFKRVEHLALSFCSYFQ
jgi:hypothetical protein